MPKKLPCFCPTSCRLMPRHSALSPRRRRWCLSPSRCNTKPMQLCKYTCIVCTLKNQHILFCNCAKEFSHRFLLPSKTHSPTSFGSKFASDGYKCGNGHGISQLQLTCGHFDKHPSVPKHCDVLAENRLPAPFHNILPPPYLLLQVLPLPYHLNQALPLQVVRRQCLPLQTPLRQFFPHRTLQE